MGRKYGIGAGGVLGVAGEPVTDVGIFAGKGCSFRESLLWGFEYHGMDVGPEAAPSLMAWKFKECFEGCDKTDVLRVLIPNLSRMAEEDSRVDGEFDGQGAYDLLGAIGGAA